VALLLLAGGGAYFFLATSKSTPAGEAATQAVVRGPTPARAPGRLVRTPPATRPVEPVEPAAPATVTKHVNSRPAGALVYKNGAYIGRTPLDVVGEENQELDLKFVLAGYEETTKTVAFASSGDFSVELPAVPAEATGTIIVRSCTDIAPPGGPAEPGEPTTWEHYSVSGGAHTAIVHRRLSIPQSRAGIQDAEMSAVEGGRDGRSRRPRSTSVDANAAIEEFKAARADEDGRPQQHRQRDERLKETGDAR
jgi:hypothetical protein